jgi:pimeloyl-ACP methyl ester carboxylesterase
VLFLHGGGQTRHAWSRSAGRLGDGFHAIALDQRGHGQSDWSPEGAYSFADYAADAAAVAREIQRRTGIPPVAVGASLGGIASLLALAEPGEPAFAALCLVDIVPDMRPEGVDAIQGFMRAHARDGFATVADAAEAVAAYLPHRPRPSSTEGLRRNLRLDPDGRWRWHWDPRFLDGPRTVNTDWERLRDLMLATAERLAVPGLLVRGAFSELVSDEAAEAFLARARGMRSVSVAKARHMVAGDSNDAFLHAVRGFLDSLPTPE